MSGKTWRPGLVVWVAVCCLVCACTSSIARADVWTFDNVTVLKPDTELLYEMGPPISTAFPQYAWSYSISRVQVQVAGFLWVTAFSDLIDGGDAYQGVPFDMWAERVDEDELEANLRLWVNEDGYPHLDVTDIVYGTTVYEGETYDVTGLRASGSVEVVGVPEPATVITFLLGAISLGLISARRRRRR